MKRQISSTSATLSALLLSACSVPSEPRVYPEAGSSAEQFYQQKCGLCHNAPHPDANTARAWFGVVQRMQMRMKSKGVSPLDKTELDDVLDYLQRHAATVEPK